MIVGTKLTALLVAWAMSETNIPPIIGLVALLYCDTDYMDDNYVE